MKAKRQAWKAAEEAKISSAAYFTAVWYLGSARYRREEYPTRVAAEAAIAMAGRDQYGRRGCVYAVTTQNETIFVG